MQSTMLFIETDLLLQEKGFELLREFVELFDENPIVPFQYSALNLEDTNLQLKAPTADFKYPTTLNSAIFQKINEGYILINMAHLKKLLSCN